MTTDPAQLSEDVARHEAEIAQLNKGVSRIESKVDGFDAKLDGIAVKLSQSSGAANKVSTNTLIAVIPLVLTIVGAGLAVTLYFNGQTTGAIEAVKQDSRDNYARNEQRIERLESQHAVEVARNNVVEFRQGRTEMLQELFTANKLRLETP